MCMMQGCLIDETKIPYDFKNILNNWSNLAMKDLDRIHSSVPRHIECLSELEKVLSKEESRRRLILSLLGFQKLAQAGRGRICPLLTPLPFI